MPPYTSNSITTALRRAVNTAKQSLAKKANKIAKHRSLRLAQQALHETFPALSHPTYPRPALQPIPLRQPVHPLRQAQQTMRMSPTPFRHFSSSPRGAAMVSRVGLGSARTFATSSVAQATNCHVALRAFAGLTDKTLPRATWYDSYTVRRRRRRNGNVRTTDSQKTRSVKDIDFFFPIATPSHITPGTDATIHIALHPSYYQILDSAPATNATVPNRFAGVPQVLQAYNAHSSHHVAPLLNKLDSLGALPAAGTLQPVVEVLMVKGQPDVLRLTLPSRSIADLKALLGETSGLGEWFALTEHAVCSESESVTDSAVSAHHALTRAASTHAASPLAPSPSESLVMPQVDSEMFQSTVPAEIDPWFDTDLEDSVELDSPAWSVSPSEADELESILSDSEWGGSRSVSPVSEYEVEGEMGRYGVVQPW